MKLRSLACCVGVLLLGVASARGAEPYLEFVRGLRERGYNDYALQYLDGIEQRRDLPADVKEALPFEKALCLLASASESRAVDVQFKQLEQARTLLEQFLKASPNHALAAEANSQLAQVYVQKGEAELSQLRLASGGQKADHQKKARAYFAEARKVFQAAHDRFKTDYDKFDPFIPKTDKARYDAREHAYINWAQAQLNLAQMTFREAHTFDKGSAENKKLLTEASNQFEQIHARHRSVVAGLYARLWQGKCFEEQDDITKALGIYNELLGHGGEKPTPVLKRLQDRVLSFELICLNHDKKKDYQVVIQKATEWMKENRASQNTRVGLGIQWELARAAEQLGKKEGTSDSEKSRLLQQSLSTARSINRFPSEYKEGSSAMIQRVMVALDRDPGDPKDFATAFALGRNLVVDDIVRRNKAIGEARGSERDRLAADLLPVLKEAARILNLSLLIASHKDDEKEVNKARYFLAYVYFNLKDHSYESAILADHVGRRTVEKQPDASLDAMHLAQAAFIQASNRERKEGRSADFEIARTIEVCNFITTHWPESEKAHEAQMNLGALFLGLQQPAEAARWYMQVPESAPQFLEAQLAAGNAYWTTYLTETIRPEEERKPQADLDGMLGQARTILRNAISRYETQLPKDSAQVDAQRLFKLTEAKLSNAQILNSSGDFKDALGLLVEGPLSVVAAVSAPEGDERQRPPRPNVRSREFASFAHQQVLRSYVGTQDLDKARGEMRELEKIEGAGGGGASLTRIYLDLGKALEKELKQLQAARDKRLGDVLRSFETFLDDLSNRKEGQDYLSLTWVAETYRALGDGMEEGDATKASGYFSKAASALQTILDEEAKKPGYIPAGGLPAVQLRKVKCLRRQKAFDEAHKLVVAILTAQKNKALLDAQFEGAQVYQDWAARGGKRDKWILAIDGDTKSGKKGDNLIWGWSGIAQRLESSLMSGGANTERQQQYLDARYNIAWCRYHDGLSQTDRKGRGELLELAERDVTIAATLSPDLGGGENWDKFNRLYKDVQRELISAGARKGEVVGLEQRVRRRPADAEKPKTAAKETNEKEPSEKKVAAKPAANKEEKKSEGGLGWILVGLVVVAGGGAAAWFAFLKKKQPVYRPFTGDPEPDPDVPETPKRKTSAKSRA